MDPDGYTPAESSAHATTLPPSADGGARRRVPRKPIGQYELIRQIGQGGMGTVYLARDTVLARRVAIKFLANPSPAVSERFLVEARATARCNHENIVVIHEVDQLDDQPYMVLEYLDGQPLRELLAAGPLPASRALELMVPVVRALVHAHGFGIVHRDLKPENIFVTDAGQVKVLDFGIAKVFAGPDASELPDDLEGPVSLETADSALVGTLPYMSPEQWGADEVDHRSDLWAVGMVLFELIAGHHPLAPLSRNRLLAAATRLDEPMPALADAAPETSPELDALVARCLRKRKAERAVDADELLAELEALLPRRRRTADVESSPYPGLAAFREQDADVFYGRDADIARLTARLRERPLLAVVGPSGAGKSSFVLAGLIPGLRRHQKLSVRVTRPGRAPLLALASSVLASNSSAHGRVDELGEEELAERLRHQPGALGRLLRQHARERGGQVLLFVDQFEELYTLGADDETRVAYLTALGGAADDPLSPVRVVLSMRSDFLDRVAGDGRFMDLMTPGLSFLAPPTRDGMRDALVEPAAAVGYRFEDDAIAREMVDELATTSGGLPLLQFAVGRLWDDRDRGRRLLTSAAYRRIGGVTGAIASHADAVVAGLGSSGQALVRRLFERLVTPDRTRDVVPRTELLALADDQRSAATLIAHLIDARLLVVRGEGEHAGIELVHESLIDGWPTLRGWLDQNQDDAAMLARLRGAAKQWSESGRDDGLLWRGDAVRQLAAWREQYRGELTAREQAFVAAVHDISTRAARRRRYAIAAGFAVLSALIIAAAVALLWIRNAEKDARAERDRAVEETDKALRATAELERANQQLAAEQRRQAELLNRLQREQTARQKARDEATVANRQVERGKVDLEKANRDLRAALVRAEEESARARQAAADAETARAEAEVQRTKAEEAALREKQRADRLEKRRGKIATGLN